MKPITGIYEKRKHAFCDHICCCLKRMLFYTHKNKGFSFLYTIWIIFAFCVYYYYLEGKLNIAHKMFIRTSIYMACIVSYITHLVQSRIAIKGGKQRAGDLSESERINQW